MMKTRIEQWKMLSVINRLAITNRTFDQELTDIISSLLNINDKILPLTTLMITRISMFASLEYDFLPMYYEYEEDRENDEYVARQIARFSCYKMLEYLSKYNSILNVTTEDIISLLGVSPTKDISKKYADEETSGHTYAMNENAPIDADIETINTPHMKSQAESGGKREYLNPETLKEDNPYYYEKYLQILEKYNIPNIITEAVKKGIFEFNTII